MQLLKIRYYQIRRDLGIWTILIAAFVFVVTREIVAEKKEFAWYISVLLALSLYQHFQQRKDLVFVRTYLNNAGRQIVINYNLLILSCTMALFLTDNYLPALFMHVFISALPWLDYKVNGPRLLFIGKLIPPTQFEWISGLRKNSVIIVLLILIALILSPVKLFGVAALFLLNLTFIGFYNIFEPRIMLNPQHLSINKFLDQKIRFLILMFLVTNLPLLIVNSFFHPEVIYINAGFFLSFLLLAANAVLIKYSNYQPGESLSFSGDFLVLIASVFIPYLLPVALILYFANRKKATTNLLQFTDHDQN